MERQINWIRVSLLNLMVVALIGVIMRYKIGFELLFFDQKHLQTAHSNFAFSGWISQTLIVLMLLVIKEKITTERVSIYNKILLINLFLAYGMLFSFALQGYGFFSIFFSTCGVLLSFVFSKLYFYDVKKAISNPEKLWFQAALVFNVLSSFGGFALNIMMATKSIKQHLYLSAVYWYLHFQYNGWFFFACMGLFFMYIKRIHPAFNNTKSMFWLFGASCIPAYGLSILWSDLPTIVYVVIIIAAVTQVFGWVEIIRELKRSSFFKSNELDKMSRILFFLSFSSLTIKLSLQLGSTVPVISKLAFGFRPIVIAYLHLVLLGFISVFLLAYIYSNKLIIINKEAIIGVIIFIIGVYLNELVLAIQGIFSLSYTVVPCANTMLLGISVFILMGLTILSFSQRKKLDVK